LVQNSVTYITLWTAPQVRGTFVINAQQTIYFSYVLTVGLYMT